MPNKAHTQKRFPTITCHPKKWFSAGVNFILAIFFFLKIGIPPFHSFSFTIVENVLVGIISFLSTPK